MARAANVSLKTVSRVVNEERSVSGPTLFNVQQTVRELGYRRNEHARALRQGLLSQPQPPTAVFTGNNRITFGVLRALAGLPRPPALVAFDDFELAPLLSPPVTVVAYDPVDLGRRAARLICERLDGADGPPRQIVVPTEVVPRGSGEVGP